ncbi:NYN domain-containing protein [Spirillospora sp. CA-142024]|uniref:NYN domain-containing protein n=1 Tax=Spirillospora sp. CA-142024 TaxID=3240036 RepID=UPI003D8C0B3D
MRYVRTALYLDFDNVFIGLFKLDPEVAIRFARDPGTWLRHLSTALTDDAERRWLILRCYLNPSGWVGHRDPSGEPTRLFFSKFRTSFVRAGFEVIDCPRYNATKNGADIRIVVDAVDALSADPGYEEFVIASGDSDMTPLLQRLRRADRRTMIVSPADTAEAFTSIADRTLGNQGLLALIQGEPVDVDDDADDAAASAFGDAVGGVVPVDQKNAYESFRSMVVTEYENASEALNMATVAQQVRDELDDAISRTRWFGFGSFARAVGSLRLPDLQMSQHRMWDQSRHAPPEDTGAAPPRITLPEPVERMVDLLNLPRLPQEWWPLIYQTLSDYACTNEFNLTECTRWSRDRLRDQGFPISRGSVTFVAQGTSYGGCPLYRQPPPTPAEIGTAFTKNVVARADDEGLSDDEIATVRAWLGAPAKDETAPEDQAPQDALG